MHVVFYTWIEDGRIFPKGLWIKHCWRQASSDHDTAFGGRFYFIKLDRKFGYMHLVPWKKPGHWTFRGYKFALRKEEKREQLNTIHAINSQENGERLKSRWREDLFQSKSASFSRMFGWFLWLEIAMYTSFYTMLEDGYKFLRNFWNKQHWTQACSYRGTAFRCELKRS